GPANTSRDHFHPPAAVSGNQGSRWEFRCRHCAASLTVKRTVSKKAAFEDEKPQPAIGNLATHVRKHGDPETLEIPGSAPGLTRGMSAASAKIMEDFLRDGKLNPASNPTQAGFNKVFAAWIIEDDLPFTTGETGGIHRLFCYMQSRFQLPSDTTAIDKWVIDREELRPLLLSSREWDLLEKLGDMLQIFSQVTLQMSRSKTPTLPWVLPMYEHMLKHLRAHRDDALLLPSLRAAATAGLEKLETYCDKAAGCQFNVVATKRGKKADILFKFVYESYKRTHDQQEQSRPPAPVAKQSSSFLDDVCMLDVTEPQTTPQQSELERFYAAVRTHGRGDANNPLAWWKVLSCHMVVNNILS
ncbi:hypothetical protein C8F04DRAFT_972208, partial [Mycena alexandri]